MKLLLSKYKIDHFSSHSSLKASVVERFIRTLKGKMLKYSSKANNHCWIEVIDKLMVNYNNSFDRSIEMTPVEGSNKKNVSKVRENLYPEINQQSRKHQYRIEDLVRINRYKSVFDKGYLQKYTTEIFKICKVKNRVPITYSIEDYNDEIIEGISYEKELVGYKKESEIYVVEKIIRKKKINGNYKYLVKWKKYPESMNSWVDKIN